MSDLRAAERTIRQFARETNLLVAGRPARVRAADSTDPGAVALSRMLRALGAQVVDPEHDAPGVVDYVVETPDGPVEILLDGAPLPVRVDAAARIRFAGMHMPISAEISRGLSLGGLRIGVAMVLEPKTAQLALLLRDAGAEVAVYAHPDETDVAVAQALRTFGVSVTADPALSGEAERNAALGFLRRGFDVVIDDGSHLIRLAHEVEPDLVAEWIGANEETTSGLAPLRLMAREGELRTPILAVNDAAAKTAFDNRYGTGQSCVFAIADLLDPLGITVRDQPALVIGYGPVGEGVAAHLAALGATVVVAEADPVRALRAAHDGYRIGPVHELAPGALVMSATGAPHTIDTRTLAVARIVAVAGGVPGEIDLAGAYSAGASLASVAAGVDRLDPLDTLVLGGGGCVNITAAEGNPIEIMDLSFAVQLAALEYLLATRPGIGVHALPPDVDQRIARAALEVRGERSDVVSDEQDSASADWRSRRFSARPEESA